MRSAMSSRSGSLGRSSGTNTPKCPRTRPSHRENLVHDLLLLGATKSEVLSSRPTKATAGAIQDSLELIYRVSGEDDSDLKLLTVLRFWGEVLVSIEYQQLWRRLSTKLSVSGPKQSHFYFPHSCRDGHEPIEATTLCSA